MSAANAIPIVPQGLAKQAFAHAFAITTAKSLADLQARMAAAIAPVGFDEFYFYEDTGSGPRVVLGSADAPRQRYEARLRGPMSDDIVHRTARQTTDPFFFSDLMESPEASALDHANMELRKANGVSEGYVGVRNRQDGVSTSTVMLAAAPVPRTPEMRLAISLIAEAYSVAARRLDQRAPAKQISLTGRQHDCLVWAARGKSDADIASILGLSAYTVQDHLAETCERMGVRTRIQAVALGVAMGLIKP